jgi:hypothetical protein
MKEAWGWCGTELRKGAITVPLVRNSAPRARRSTFFRAILATVPPVAAALLFSSIPPAWAQHMLEGQYHWTKPPSGDREIHVRVNDLQYAQAFTDARNEWAANSEFSFTQTSSSNCNIDADEASLKVCDGNYGNTGWGGLAEMVVVGPHILRGRVRLNTYYPWDYHSERSTWCQELGHFLGLDHRGDSGTAADDADSCMSYHPSEPEHPDSHDLKQLACQTHTSAEDEPAADCLNMPSSQTGGTGGGGSGGGEGNPPSCLLFVLLCHTGTTGQSVLLQFAMNPPPGSFEGPRHEVW